MKKPLLVSYASFLALGLIAAAAVADVDVTVENSDKIQGTIAFPGTVDTYRIVCPAGAKLQVKAKGKQGMQPDVGIAGPSEPDPMKGGITDTLDPLPRSGVYVVSVGAEAGSQGDYSLSISVKTAKKLSETITLGAGESSLPFSVERGTTMKVKAKAAKGSLAVPRILRVEGPDGFRLDLGVVGKAASDTLGKTELPRDGDYVLVLDDAGDAGGDVSVAVSLKQRKAARRRIDMRERTIGSSLGERLAVSDVVGTDGGVVGVATPDEGGPFSVIGGASVAVPSGALTSPTPIVVATSSDVQPKGLDGGAGPSVFFGPEGLRFETSVAVTIPFDFSQFEAGDTSTLRIYTRDAAGKVSLVPGPYDVDTESGTCTFQVSHFSSFRAARAGAGALARDVAGVWKLVDEVDPTDLTFYIISDNGRVELVFGSTLDPFCVHYEILPPGVPLDQIFRVENGMLRFADPQDPTVFEPAKAKDVPKNCEDFGAGKR